MWVRRDSSNKIDGAAYEHLPNFDEELASDNAELRAFLDSTTSLDQVSKTNYDALIDRRVRALNRESTIAAQMAAINLKLGV